MNGQLQNGDLGFSRGANSDPEKLQNVVQQGPPRRAMDALRSLCTLPTCSCDCIYGRVDRLMKSQAALKIIVMFTLLISDIDVFFLGVSMYEYSRAEFQIGLIAVGGMAIVYLGGVYFGAMQRFKLDAHIIQCCEQGAL